MQLVNYRFASLLQIPHEQIRNFKICPDLNECLTDTIRNNRLAVAAPRKHVLHSPLQFDRYLYCFAENESIQRYSTAFFVTASLMAEHRELFEQINRYIQLTLEGGLLLQWTSEAQMQQKTQTLVAVETVQMTFDRIFLPLFLYVTLSVMAIFAFGLELAVSAKCKQRNAHRFWRIVSRAIDGKRHYLLLK